MGEYWKIFAGILKCLISYFSTLNRSASSTGGTSSFLSYLVWLGVKSLERSCVALGWIPLTSNIAITACMSVVLESVVGQNC